MNRTTENKKQITPKGKPRRTFFERMIPGLVCILLSGLTLGMALLGASQKHAASAENAALLISRQEAIETQQQNIVAQKQALDTQAQAIDTQSQTIERLEGILSYALGQDYSGQPFKTRTVHATAYTARAQECNSQPWVTASGTPSRVGVIAVSRDIEQIGIKLGDLVIIKGMGLFRVEDRMNKRWTNRIDILHANLEAARRFAKREVEIMWVGRSQTASQEQDKQDPLG
jgi:3D (Asp-Asp-Asp) domain-containing protein